MEIYEVLEGAWRTKNISMPHRCWLWRNILKGWEVHCFVSFKIRGWEEIKLLGAKVG